jgi:hypothetical protein
MMATDDAPQGFETPGRELPTSAAQISAAVRDRMVHVLAAMLCGKTPEEIAGYVQDGFPAAVDELLARPHEADELDGHVDLLLSVQQAS